MKDKEHIDINKYPNFIQSEKFLQDNSKTIPNNNILAMNSKMNSSDPKDSEFGFVRDSEDIFVVQNAKNHNKEKLQSIYQTNINKFLLMAINELNIKVCGSFVREKTQIKEEEHCLTELKSKLQKEQKQEKIPNYGNLLTYYS